MKAKRFLAIFLATATLFSLAACGENKDDSLATVGDQLIEEPIESPDAEIGDGDISVDPVKPEESKPTQTPSSTKEPSSTPTQKPTQAPTQTPESKPTATPTPTPEQKPQTVGKILLADFNAKAASAASATALGEAILSNPIIPFAPAVMQVEPGMLNGFGNAEINGFKDGAMFGPMIGSIPFIGYVFELDDATNKSEFISTLKNNANLRWNVCVEADEMVVGSSGNKVFFVMCTKEFSEE